MRHTMKFLVLVAVAGGLVNCRTTHAPDATAPHGDARPAGGEVGAWSSGETGTTTAAPVTPGTKYTACPNALCAGRQAAAGGAAIRGCEAGAAPVEPPPLRVDPDEGSTCTDGASRGGYGAMPSSVAAGMAAPMQPMAMAPPPAPPSGGPMMRAQMVGGVGAASGAMPEEEIASADELVVMEDQEDGNLAPTRSPAAGDDRDASEQGGGAAAAPTQGTLRATTPDGRDAGEFPLRHTEVTAEISGYIAKTVVEQQYTNPFHDVIEAVYTFPLPGMAAVNDFVMQVGERKIVGLVRPREEAEAIYAAARARGQTASLLTQERPNIFTQSVANIEPGGEVKISITFFEKLAYENKQYEWVFPMVVGPRYIPGGAPAGSDAAGDQRPATGDQPPAAPGGGGTAAPTSRVPDADRITPPVLRPGERSGTDIGLTVKLDAGLPIQALTPVTHCVDVEEVSDSQRVIQLSASDTIPNRDFVLRWKVAGAETQFGVLAHRGDEGGFLTLMVQPPAAPTDAQVTPREITFIIDVSGSQMGLPLGISKEIVRRTLDELRGDDTFNIFFFASGNGQLWDAPQPRTTDNVAEARRFLDQLCGGGGTEMLDGIRRALHGTHDARHLQMYVFLTDGYVGNEDEILNLIKTERGEARFFAFGIGSSVNRYLVDGVGQFGGGNSYAVLPRDPDQAGKAVQHLFDMIDSPILLDAKIDWNGLPVTDQYPAQLPDLFAGQTINVVARYSAPAEGTAYIEARVGAEHVRLPVAVRLPEREDAHAALAPIWARWRIAELSKEFVTADESRQAELKRQITDLAVEFRLVSQYTAFVAVDDSHIVGNGRPVRVVQPVELPEGVSYAGVFGEQPVGQAFDVPAWGLTLQMSQSGKVRVGAVQLNGPAAQAGVAAGATITQIDHTMVHDLTHLEGLVLQGGRTLTITFEPGGSVTLPAP